MTKRSKSGISKPKLPIGLSVVGSSNSLPESEPFNFSEPIKHSALQQAMADEYQALDLVKQGTWTIVPPPSNANVMGCQ